MNSIYFDNAATTFPKPETVINAMDNYFRSGGSPGRSGHRMSVEAGRTILDSRDLLADLFNIEDPFQIVFTQNATEALNLSIFGLLGTDDHVITSSMEHNSVMRPLRYLEQNGLELSIIPCSENGDFDPDEITPLIKKNTRALFLTHASNVTGSIMPLSEAGKISREYGLVFCVDSAQTAGTIPIDVNDMNMDLLAFTGHKSLFGPQGTGGLYIRKGLEKDLSPILMGGTGSRSEFEEQPDFMPDKYESGTPNTPGIAGLGAGIDYILSEGIDIIRAREKALTDIFLDGLSSIAGVTIYGPTDKSKRTSVVSFNINGMSPSETALKLHEEHGIMSRPGLHCAPSAHKTIGSYPEGTVRFSFGYFNTEDEINIALEAVDALCHR